MRERGEGHLNGIFGSLARRLCILGYGKVVAVAVGFSGVVLEYLKALGRWIETLLLLHHFLAIRTQSRMKLMFPSPFPPPSLTLTHL